MNIKPVASPHAIAATQASPSAAQDARARAIAKLVPSAPAQTEAPAQSPVRNQNAVSAEEMGAIVPPTSKTQGQKHGSEETPDTALETSEAPATDEKKAPEPEDPLSKQYALLAKREKALRAKAQQQEQVLRAKEAELQTREQQLKSKETEYSTTGYIPKSRLQQNTLQVLAENGINVEQFIQEALNQPQVDPRLQATMDRMQARIDELEGKTEQSQKAATDAQKQQYDAAVNQIRTDVKKLVFTDPTFELVKATNSVNDVVELIEQTYSKDKVLLTIEEATQMVEEHLQEEIDKLTKLEKIQKRLRPAPEPKQDAPAQTAAAPAKPQTQPQMKTLTNANSSARKLSARERAIAKFKGESL